MRILRIFIPVKFTQSSLDDIITTYYESSYNDEFTQIIFDLSLLEWINTEEIAFLFAWIRNVYFNAKSVMVFMPYPYNIYDQRLYTNKEDLLIVNQLLPKDNLDRITRRRNRNIFLLSVWGMLDNLGIPSSEFKNKVENFNVVTNLITEKYSHKIVPFVVVNSEKMVNNVGNPYADVINGLKVINRASVSKPFDLGKEIINRLETFNCYSPFENKIISNIITKELFANSLIHANSSGKLNGREECYFALSLNNKREKTTGDYFLDQFVKEKDPETLDFFKDKSNILKEIKALAQKAGEKQLVKYSDYQEADLSKFTDLFRNISYLEFTFLDFGEGIINTLTGEYDKYIKSKGTSNFKNTVKANQILEYAFWPESSRNHYHARLEHPELFPRGLYFLVDMVRRYKGLLTIRSGEGKIIYDFSDRIILQKSNRTLNVELEAVITVYDAIKSLDVSKSNFDGTLISIILPERRKEDVNYSPVRVDNRNLTRDIYLSSIDSEATPAIWFKPESYGYISMLFIYENVINKISPEELSEPKGFDSLFYIELLDELRKFENQKCVIFIDFEHYPKSDNIQQMLFYLTNSPYINEHTKAVILNLSDIYFSKSNLYYSVLEDFKINLFAIDNEPHIFRPIPVINLSTKKISSITTENIKWIGVQNKDDEIILNKLLIGDLANIHRKKVQSKTNYSGNLFAYNQDLLYPIFNSDHDLSIQFEHSRRLAIHNLIKNLITNCFKKSDDKLFIYQAARGSFLLEYLSLYETLHNKYLTKYFAKKLLDQYIEFYGGNEIKKFEKIITVTVSSQLLGAAVRDLIHEDPDYKLLRIGNTDSIESCPKLIMLSSYYSFEDEKPFNKIHQNDNVLIVNDVISTGSLVSKLLNGVVVRKRANIVGLMSIADCRLIDIDKLKEVTCTFSENESHFFSLISGQLGEITIRNYKTKDIAYQEFKDYFNYDTTGKKIAIKRINPLLNTVVELSDDYAEKQRILFTNPSDFLPFDKDQLELYQKRYLKIGHFVSNLSHNTYLTDMRAIFSEDEGGRILEAIKKEIDSEYQHKLYNDFSNDRTKLFSLKSLADQLEDKNIAHQLLEQINSLLQQDTRELQNNSSKYNYKPDFIFYPIFSGVENLNHDKFTEIFGTDQQNIIGLQRFDTDKGWRFPFPPKRFNKLTKNKHILIFDSGALTGESLVQMVDTISFLDVSKIDVITVIGRIEDFNREFFSRIKAIKVKSLNDKPTDFNTDQDSEKDFISKNKISFSNLNIIFGINLHIPVHSSKSMCPFCEELSELYLYAEMFSEPKFPGAARKYIESRLLEIKRVDISIERSELPPPYIPHKRLQNKKELKYDLVSIFLMRDRLGKIDSFRFYKEYYNYFDDHVINHISVGTPLTDKKVIKRLELIMICILHEPKLFKMHRDLLINIHDKCSEILLDFINDRLALTYFQYEWKKYAIIRLVVLYHNDKIANIDFCESLFRFANDDNESLQYLSFVYLNNIKPILKNNSNQANSEFYKANLQAFDDRIRHTNNQDDVKKYSYPASQEIIEQLIKFVDPVLTSDINEAFSILKNFFKTEHSDSKHDELIELIANLKTAIGSEIDDEDIERIHNLISRIYKIIKDKVYLNLNSIKKLRPVCTHPVWIYNQLFDEPESVYNLLQKLQDDYYDFKHTYDIITAEPTLTFIDVKKQIKQFNKSLNNLQVKHFFTTRDFNKFCGRYICSLEYCINKAIESREVQEEISKRNNFKLNRIKDNQTIVDAHYDFLFYGFKEFFKNAAKRVENDNATISINIQKDTINHDITLIVNQDKPFIKNEANHDSGIENDIKPIFKIFCGHDNVSFLDTNPAFFEIKLKFTFTKHIL